MNISENQSIASVKEKLEQEKEEAVKKVKEEMKVCNMLKVFISKGSGTSTKQRMRNVG